MSRHPTRIDWGEALAFYIALGPVDRTYAAVARQFGISEAGVRRVAKRDNWYARAVEIDQRQAELMERDAVKSLTVRNRRTIRLVNAARDNYLDALELKGLVPDGREVAALLRIEQLIEGEADRRIEVKEVRELVVRVISEQDAALVEIIDGEGFDPVIRGRIIQAFRSRTRHALEAAAGGELNS